MPVNLRGRSYLKLLDYTPAEIRYLLELSKDFKRMKRAGTPHRYLAGKNIVLLFEKTSTRTRCSFEVAGRDLGLGVTYLDPGSSQMGKKESIADTARVLGRMFDGIEYRGFSQKTVEDLAKYAGVPVWNGLTDDMGNSLMVLCAKMGLHFTACAPKALFPAPELVDECRKIAEETGATIRLTEDVLEGTRDADVLYTDIWVSMGEPDEVWESRIQLLKPYQVNAAAMANAKPTAIFMHCLPSYHDTNTTIDAQIAEKYGITEMEVTDQVFESKQSVVFDEAENRMHTIKAVIYATLC